ncbi:MAG TPA: TIGR01458 family HAD-type hydrolase [Bryobacteraceae bacterium]|nr:TIGR01458 family HAD-type hydrolase [Bryobacteraceae bacterium]
MTSKQLRGLLFDMDGVLYNSEEPIPGAAAAVNWARTQGIPHLFVTNTSSRGKAALVEKLARFGLAAREDEILNPGSAAAAWLQTQLPGSVALFLKPAAREEFEGLPCLADDVETGASYVVVGDLGEGWNYHTLNRAFRLLQSNPQARLVALGMTRYWQTPDGLALDVAPFVAALEHASGRQAVVLGKPAAAFFRAAAEILGAPPESVMMVGDDIHADIAGAQAAGLKAALVETGKFRPSDLESGVQPDLVLHSLADLPRWWSA